MDYTKVELKIKPNNKGKSDKYSWQIFDFVSKQGSNSKRVFINRREDNPNGEISKASVSDIIIGCLDDKYNNIYGNSLNNILSSKGKYLMYCYLNKRLGWNFVERTDDFWNGYIEKGMCVIDRKHKYRTDTDRWTYIDTVHRTCKWCGCKQELKKYIYTEERENWFDIEQKNSL